MESKVIMYDAAGTQVGETYSRRARQLVKQQRAVWADETHTSIRFTPDTPVDWEPEPIPSPTAHPHPPHPTADRSSALYAMAEKRVRDRRRLIWHTAALVPVFFIILIWGLVSYDSVRGGGELYLVAMGFAWGAWIMSYVSRLRSYLNMNGYPRLSSWEARHKLVLDVEVDRLRRMGYTE